MKYLPIVIMIYAAASLATFVAFAIDKRLAVNGRRRIRESTLHMLEALGGWPGALIAMRVVRHKTRDASYLPLHRLIIAAHMAAIIAALLLR